MPAPRARAFSWNGATRWHSATSADIVDALRRNRELLDALLALQGVLNLGLRCRSCLRGGRGDDCDGDVLEHGFSPCSAIVKGLAFRQISPETSLTSQKGA